jgi:hypothetical protein
MKKGWRWQRITFALVALSEAGVLCFTGKIGPEVYAGLFAATLGMFTYQKYQESKPTNGGT